MKNLALLVLLSAACFAQQSGTTIPAAVTTDPPQQADRKFAARMVELHVPALNTDGKPTGELMNGIMYIAAGEGPHPTVILLHGFPGNEQNLDLAQSIRRAGWNVLYFHYRGSWGSQRNFSFSSAMLDTLTAIRFAHDSANVKKYSIDDNRIVLIGHSMGGFMAANASANDSPFCCSHTRRSVEDETISLKMMLPHSIAGLVLISPWDLGRAGNFLADKPENKKYIAGATEEFRGYQPALHGFTAESGIAEARAHANDWQLTSFAPKIVDRKVPVLLVYGQFEDAREEGFTLLRDAFQSAEQKAGTAADFTSIVLPTDHAYSDQRIALQATIVSWLEKLKR